MYVNCKNVVLFDQRPAWLLAAFGAAVGAFTKLMSIFYSGAG